MKNQSKTIFSSWFMLFFLLYWQPIHILAQPNEDNTPFDYIHGSKRGPEHWGDLKKEWAACKNGRMQSPIDILNKSVKVIPNLGDLKMNYKPSNATLQNRGHSTRSQWVGDAGSIRFNGTDFSLKQSHWHSPAEHLINGKRYDLELHMVHTDTKNQIAVVVSLLFEIGQPDSFLSKFTEDIRSLIRKKEERNKGVIDPREAKTDVLKYYGYIGSITFPPCTEGVNWIINEEISTVSEEQVQLLRQAIFDYKGKNARPLQPLNGRAVYLHCSKNVLISISYVCVVILNFIWISHDYQKSKKS